MARTKRYDATKQTRPLSRHVIREGLDQYQLSVADRQFYDDRNEHYRQAKEWMKTGIQHREEGHPPLEDKDIPSEFLNHYHLGYASRG